jgi:hypothetical protein
LVRHAEILLSIFIRDFMIREFSKLL